MPQPRMTARHVETISQLPQKLILGRMYFIDDEHYIVIDHGQGAQKYGDKAGPQGRPGEPIPELQNQIDSLTDASIRTSENLQIFNDLRKSDIAFLQNARVNDLVDIYNQFSMISQGVIETASVVQQMYEQLRNSETTILKLLIESNAVHSISALTPGDTLNATVDDKNYSWSILDSSINANEGTIIFSLNS